MDKDLSDTFLEIEELIYRDPENPSVNWGQNELVATFENTGFEVLEAQSSTFEVERRIKIEDVERWFSGTGGQAGESFAQRLSSRLNSREITRLKKLFENQLLERETLQWVSCILFISAVKRNL